MWKPFSALTLLIAVHIATSACGNSPTSPTTTFDAPPAIQGASPSSLIPPDTIFRDYTIGFSGLATAENRTPVTMYTESGFLVIPTMAAWMAIHYGNPAPSLQFEAQIGETIVGEIAVASEDGAPFRLTSVDLYASTTPIPYVITGTLLGQPRYTAVGTQGNTFGRFVKVDNQHKNVIVDRVTIQLTNRTGVTCCRNPMGLDNIVVRR
jgi:hypothetical protein